VIARLAVRSLANRWVTAALTAFTIGFSVLLLLGVEKVRTGARASFADTISGTDLILGARSGNVNLLLWCRYPSATPTSASASLAPRRAISITTAIGVANALPLHPVVRSPTCSTRS
jgi:hypothetical protein